MSRILPPKFSMSYETSFFTNIRGHHVCKSAWPENSEKLDCHKGDRDEASMHDNHVIGVYKREKDSALVGHVPTERSNVRLIF